MQHYPEALAISGSDFIVQGSNNGKGGGKGAFIRRKSAHSMRSLAESLGVSPATVSRALRNQSSISAPVRATIIGEARKRGVLAPHSRNVAVLIPPTDRKLSINTLLYMNALFRESEKRGFRLDFIPANQSEPLNERIVSGVISLDFLLDFGHRFGEYWSSLPFVCVNESSSILEGSVSVCPDEKRAVEAAVDLLAEHGHSRIALLFMGRRNVYSTALRLNAFRSRIAARSCTGTILSASEPDEFCGAGFEAVSEWILKNHHTGVVCCGKECFRRWKPFLDARKLSCPRDLEIVAWMFPDGPDAFPQIHAVVQQFEEQIRCAVLLLEKKIRGGTCSNLLVENRIFVRGE